MTYTFKRLKATDPLCQKGGALEQTSYSLGLILTDAPVIKDSTGEWLIGPVGAPLNEGWSVKTERSYANVHPMYAGLDRTLRHDGLRVYGIRFFIPACDSCWNNEDYGNRWTWDQTLCSTCSGGE